MKQSAFTLIELSIVLVIIGLIVGGVLVGQDLIRAAQLRAVLGDVQKVDTAINTFRLKYNCLSGDCANATQFFGVDASCPTTAANTTPKEVTCNGNGDKIIGGSDASFRYEWYRFWQHLANADLIEGKYSGTSGAVGDWDCTSEANCMASIDGGRYIIYYVDSPLGSTSTFPMTVGHFMMFGKPRTDGGGAGWPALPIITPVEAEQIDTKNDDGMPGTGNIRSRRSTDTYTPNCASGTDPATAIYRATLTTKECILLFAVM